MQSFFRQVQTSPFDRITARQDREADLFFEELTGVATGLRPREYWPAVRGFDHENYGYDGLASREVSNYCNSIDLDADSYSEAAAQWDKRIVPGTGVFEHDGYRVEARWNFDKKTAQEQLDQKIDMVVYLHGYGRHKRNFLASKAMGAGLNMVDINGVVTVRKTKPTLALVPKATVYRKERRTLKNNRTILVHHRKFPRLYTRTAFNNLLTAGLSWLEVEVLSYGVCALEPGKVTLMAHSGGGAAMNRLLNDGLVPDELVCYDSTYGSAAPIVKWVKKKLASGSSSSSGGLRVFHRGGKTANAARRIKRVVDSLLAQRTNCATLALRYRVEQTRVGHNRIPKAFSKLLLNDITANVPNTTVSRVPCALSTGRSRTRRIGP